MCSSFAMRVVRQSSGDGAPSAVESCYPALVALVKLSSLGRLGEDSSFESSIRGRSQPLKSIVVAAGRVAASLRGRCSRANERFDVNGYPNSRIIALSTAFAMLGLDQLTKHLALVSFGAVGTTIELAGPIDLTLVLNRSNSFGLVPVYGEFSRWALTALNLAVP
jgi:hypothetical protein